MFTYGFMATYPYPYVAHCDGWLHMATYGYMWPHMIVFMTTYDEHGCVHDRIWMHMSTYATMFFIMLH